VQSNPFTTLESAQEFIELLWKSIDETRGDIASELATASAAGEDRRAAALELAAYKLNLLRMHTQKTGRLLNDLRLLRNLLHREESDLQSVQDPNFDSTSLATRAAAPVYNASEADRLVSAV
jgi:hypothetical protein